MMFLVIGAGLGVLAILFRLAALTRLTLPLLYTLSMLTVFHSWYQANATMADNILFVLVGLVILSWLLSLGKCVWSFIREQSDVRWLQDWNTCPERRVFLLCPFGYI